MGKSWWKATNSGDEPSKLPPSYAYLTGLNGSGFMSRRLAAQGCYAHPLTMRLCFKAELTDVESKPCLPAYLSDGTGFYQKRKDRCGVFGFNSASKATDETAVAFGAHCCRNQPDYKFLTFGNKSGKDKKQSGYKNRKDSQSACARLEGYKKES